MLDFKKITIDDIEKVNSLLIQKSTRITEHCFTDLFIWKDHFKTEICIKDGFFYTKSAGFKGGAYYIAPVGSGDFKKALEEIIRDAKERDTPFFIGGMTAEIRSAVEAALPGLFDFSERRDAFEYLYASEALIGLSGKKYHSKRNFLNRFTAVYDGRWEYSDMKTSESPEVFDFHLKWCEYNGCKMNELLRQEICAVKEGLKHFDRLGMKGGILRLDGDIIAFSFGTLSSAPDTFIIHVEKAAGDVPGAYPMINWEFAKRNCSDVRYINREEDLGIEGLRKSKLSYHPEFLIEKYVARLK